MASKEHDKGVAAAKLWLGSQGYTVKAAPTVGGHEADAYGEKEEAGKKDGKPTTFVHKRMVEVETADSISGQDAKDQMNAFAAWAGKFPSRKAVLFVPKAKLEDAKKALPKYDLYAPY